GDEREVGGRHGAAERGRIGGRIAGARWSDHRKKTLTAVAPPTPPGAGTADHAAGPPPGPDNPKRPTAPLPRRTIAHEAHRESVPTSGSAVAGATDTPHPTLEAKPPLRAPAFALKGPLPDDPVKLWE